MTDLLEHPLVLRLGWALLHSLWQGAVLAALAAVALRLLRRRSAQARYLAGCAALLLLAGAPVATFLLLPADSAAPPTPEQAGLPPPKAVAPPVSGSGRVDALLVTQVPQAEKAEVPRLAPPAGPGRSASGPVVQEEEDAGPADSTAWTAGPLKAALPWLVIGWVAGVAFLSLRLATGWLQVRRLTWVGLAPVGDEWADRLGALAGQLALWQPVRLFRSALVEVPTVIGWLRPVLLLPASALTGLAPRQLEAILAHELAHVRRHDYLVNLLQSLVEVLLFYHPAVWWLSAQVRRERESCCDDLAVALCGDRLLYARALLALAESRQPQPVLGLAAGGGVLLERIRRLLGVAGPHGGGYARPLAGGAALALLLALGLTLGVLGWATGEGPAEPAAGKDSPEEIVKRLTPPRPDFWQHMGSTIFFQVNGSLAHYWEAGRLPKLRDEPAMKALVDRGPGLAPALNKALAALAADHPAAERLAVVLGQVGDKDSVPVLINVLRRADALRQDPKGLGSWQGTGAAALWGLWELTGRPLDQDVAAWEKWWRAVRGSFVPARQRGRARVTRDQVRALVGQLPDPDRLVREQLVILGPNAVRHLLEVLKTAAAPVRFQVAWVIDEIGWATEMPADLRRQYFIERLSDAKETGMSWERACDRAFSQQSFADFCRTALAVSCARAGKGGRDMWGVIKSGLPQWRQVLGDTARTVPPALPIIIDALDDRRLPARRVAIQLADRIGFDTRLKPPELLKALERHWLKETNDDLRVDTAIALSRFDTPEVRRAIRRELFSMREVIVADSITAGLIFGNFFDPRKDADVYKRCLDLTSSANDRIRSQAVRALNYHAPEMLLPYAQRLARDRLTDVRHYCASAIGRGKDPAHLKILLGLLHDPQESVWDRALDALGAPAYAAGLPVLVPLLKDPKMMYRAQWAIVGMGGRPALAALMQEYRKGNTVGDTLPHALHKLTGKNFKSREEWLGWWDEQEKPARQGGARSQAKPAARVTLTPQRPAYFLGENILVHYRLENAGKEPVRYDKGGFYPELRRNDGYRVTAALLDEKGRPTGELAPAIPEPANHGGPVTHWTLAPGGVYEQTLYLPRYLRFQKPGRYRVRISNVVRLNPQQELSAGEVTLTLKLPTPAEARAVYQRMKKLPAGPVAGIGERSDTEIQDFQALLHPIYLTVLADRAAAKDADALAGLGQIHTAEATAALVKLIGQALAAGDLDFALLVYRQVESRLPNPRWYAEDQTYAAQRAFIEKVWRPDFAKGVRQLASWLARDPGGKGLGAISYIYECVGVAGDLPDLARGYTKSIEATKTLPFETHQYFRPRGSAYGYRFAARQLVARGAKVPAPPQTPGEAAVYFIALADRKDFRPEGWQQQAVRWLKHETPYMREFVLEHLPEPVPAAALDLLPRLLADEYIDLQIAACHTARKHPRPAYRQPLLAILCTGKEEHLLNAATAAGPPNSIPNDQIMEAWLDRLSNDDLGGTAVVRLLVMVLGDNLGRAEFKLSDAVRTATVARWRQFIKQNRERLRRGPRFQIGDPEITPDLFPPGFQFHHQGKLWPMGQEGS
jgi:beta-lactamase regulating signal transducer with metallopeptidase domain/HEAT repeat protein